VRSCSRLAALPLLLSPLLLGVASGADQQGSQAKGRIRVLTTATGTTTGTTTAFMSADPARPGGIEYELLVGFAQLHAVELQIVSVPSWADLIPALLAGKGDLIGGGFMVSDTRRKQVDFTVETFPTRTVIVTRRPRQAVTTLERLKSIRVGTVRGAAMVDQLRAVGVPEDRIVIVKDESVLDTLTGGKVDARAVPVHVAIVLAKDHPEVELGMYVGAPGSLAFGVRKDNPQLRDALSEYLNNVRHTATWNRLLVKYLGPSAADILRSARTE
jgi:membrane-bound lytic murein transglycosylase F